MAKKRNRRTIKDDILVPEWMFEDIMNSEGEEKEKAITMLIEFGKVGTELNHAGYINDLSELPEDMCESRQYIQELISDAADKVLVKIKENYTNDKYFLQALIAASEKLAYSTAEYYNKSIAQSRKGMQNGTGKPQQDKATDIKLLPTQQAQAEAVKNFCILTGRTKGTTLSDAQMTIVRGYVKNGHTADELTALYNSKTPRGQEEFDPINTMKTYLG